MFAPGVGALRLPAKGRRILDATRKVQQASTPVPNVFGAQNRATAAAVGAVEEAAKPSPGIIQRGVEKGADLSGKVSQKAAQAFDFLEPYKTPLRVAGAGVGAAASQPGQELWSDQQGDRQDDQHDPPNAGGELIRSGNETAQRREVLP